MTAVETSLKKKEFAFFQLNRVYLDPLKMLMQETFPEDEFLRILFKFKKRTENVHVLHKTSK